MKLWTELESAQFTLSVRGYDRDEVDDFIDTAVAAVREVEDRSSALHAKVKALESELAVRRQSSSSVEHAFLVELPVLETDRDPTHRPEDGRVLDFGKQVREDKCRRGIGRGDLVLGPAQRQVRAEPVDPIRVAMVAIVAQLRRDVDQDEDCTRQADRETGHADGAVGAALPRILERNSQVVAQQTNSGYVPRSHPERRVFE